jgi:exodeoxyribonuclease-3
LRLGRIGRRIAAVKLTSWNVNGLRAALGKGLLDWIAQEDADVICLQEVKAMPEQVSVEWPSGYSVHWNSAERKGYSGTLTLSRLPVLSVERGLGSFLPDNEGRVLTVELPDQFVVNCYTPNTKRDLSRLPYRELEWDPAFRAHLKALEARKPVVFCGDLNVAHEEIDLANPKANVRNHGFTIEERSGFSRLMEAGFVDTFRDRHPGQGGHYTWWSPMAGARSRNVGWRIDYCGISGTLRPALKEAFIRPSVRGSDHCPVGLVLG